MLSLTPVSAWVQRSAFAVQRLAFSFRRVHAPQFFALLAQIPKFVLVLIVVLRPRLARVFCSEKSWMVSQLFCSLILMVKHQDFRERRTTTRTRTIAQFRSLGPVCFAASILSETELPTRRHADTAFPPSPGLLGIRNPFIVVQRSD